MVAGYAFEIAKNVSYQNHRGYLTHWGLYYDENI